MPKPGRSPESNSDQGLTGAISLTVIHSILFLGLLVLLVTVVPRYARTFEDFDMDLPVISSFVIQVSYTVSAYWYLFVLFGFAGIALDFVILFLLGKTGRIAQFAAGMVFALVTLLLAGLVCLGIWLPMKLLVEGLQ